MADPRLDAHHVAVAFGAPATFLGGGAFGDTWHINGRAEKVLCGAPFATERLEREIEALRRIRHPRVVTLHEVRTVAICGVDYITMSFEFVHGYDAAHAITAGHLVQPAEARDLLVGLLEAADELHGARVVHRDIKPANVILRGSDWTEPVLCDLGLARIDDLTSITQYPAHVGTAAYMPPDQLEGRRARKGADLWAIGVVVREALAGRHPFFVAGDMVTVERLADGPIPVPAGVDEDVAVVLDDLASIRRHRRGTARSNLNRLGA